MSWTNFEKAVESGKLPPLLVFYGPEAALRERALARIRELAPDATVVHHEGRDLSRLHEELFTPSLFAPRKIVIFNPEELPADWLTAYAKAPADGALLLIHAPGNRAPKAPASALVVACETPKGAALAGEIEREARRQGKSIDPRAADRMADRLGDSGLARLETEVAKLARYVGTRDRITEKDVEAMIADEQSYRTFDLVDRIVDGAAGDALRILHRLLDQGESPQLLMGGIGWQVRKMLQVRRAMASGIPGPQACADAGIRWKQAEFARRVSRAGLDTLQACHDRLLQTDVDLKSSGAAAGEALLEALVLRLAAALAPAR